jgi:hypothetical protein
MGLKRRRRRKRRAGAKFISHHAHHNLPFFFIPITKHPNNAMPVCAAKDR